MIPFSKTTLSQEEKDAVSSVIDSGWVVLGPKSAQFEEEFAKYVGAKHAVFVDSGTAALDLAVKYAKHSGTWPEGRTVDVPSLTFTSTAEVLVHNGYEPHFVDVDKHTFCARTDRAMALPVHLLGNKAQCSNALIYDSAHRIEKDDFPKHDPIETWCYSFYATKNITTVTGGMIVTNSQTAADWLRKARDHGLNLGTKERYTGAYKQYEVEFVGWRVKGDDLRAAVGLEQLKKLPWITERRNHIVNRYNEGLGIHRTGNHVYPVLVKHQESFVNHMFEEGIQTTVHFRPLHRMLAYRSYERDDLPNTEYIGDHIVSLPLYPQMSEEEIDYVITTVKKSNMLL